MPKFKLVSMWNICKKKSLLSLPCFSQMLWDCIKFTSDIRFIFLCMRYIYKPSEMPCREPHWTIYLFIYLQKGSHERTISHKALKFHMQLTCWIASYLPNLSPKICLHSTSPKAFLLLRIHFFKVRYFYMVLFRACLIHSFMTLRYSPFWQVWNLICVTLSSPLHCLTKNIPRRVCFDPFLKDFCAFFLLFPALKRSSCVLGAPSHSYFHLS